MKIKIKPSEKSKRRYILLAHTTKKEVESIILDYLGILGWAKANPFFVSQKNKDSNYLILAIDRKQLENIRAAFEISKTKAKIIRVSGTIKGLKINS